MQFELLVLPKNASQEKLSQLSDGFYIDGDGRLAFKWSGDDRQSIFFSLHGPNSFVVESVWNMTSPSDCIALNLESFEIELDELNCVSSSEFKLGTLLVH